MLHKVRLCQDKYHLFIFLSPVSNPEAFFETSAFSAASLNCRQRQERLIFFHFLLPQQITTLTLWKPAASKTTVANGNLNERRNWLITKRVGGGGYSYHHYTQSYLQASSRSSEAPPTPGCASRKVLYIPSIPLVPRQLAKCTVGGLLTPD